MTSTMGHHDCDSATRGADVFQRECPSCSALEDITGKWAPLALIALGDGAHRFSELRRKVDGVSDKMLAQNLRALERDGFVTRTVLSTIPARVDYALTTVGSRVAGALRVLADVLEESAPVIATAREQYDADLR